MNNVNTKGWQYKKSRISSALSQKLSELVTLAAQDIYDKTDANLSGPSIKPGIKGSENSAIGEMPVPRRTGDLADSLTMIRIAHAFSMVFIDREKAGYGKYVHDGTKYMKPRRFLGDVVDANLDKWIKRFRKEVLADMRRVGR